MRAYLHKKASVKLRLWFKLACIILFGMNMKTNARAECVQNNYVNRCDAVYQGPDACGKSMIPLKGGLLVQCYPTYSFACAPLSLAPPFKLVNKDNVNTRTLKAFCATLSYRQCQLKTFATGSMSTITYLFPCHWYGRPPPGADAEEKTWGVIRAPDDTCLELPLTDYFIPKSYGSVRMNKCLGDAENQKWKRVGNTLQSGNGQCLFASGGDGNAMDLRNCDGTPQQTFIFEPRGALSNKIRPSNSQCLDINFPDYNQQKSSGQRLRTYNCTGNANQEITFNTK